MNRIKKANISLIVHMLSWIAGILGIIAGSAPQLDIPSYVVSILALTIVVLNYISNQLPSLGSGANPNPAAQPQAPPAGASTVTVAPSRANLA